MRGTFEKGPIFHAPKPDIDFITALGLDPHYKHKRPDTLSFEQYFRGHYEKMICGSIQDQINAGTLKPGKGTYRIPQPDKAVCDNAYIHQMRFRSSNSATIFFQVIVITEITLFAHLGDMWVSDRRKEWYLIDGIFDTEDVDHHMTLGNIRIYRAGDEPDGQILTEYLIPWFDEQQVNDEAERILKLYIPEALEKPMRISAKLLAERMKLKVKYLHLASHDNALGLLFFRDKSILNIYATRCKKARGELAAMMTATTWMDAKAALLGGFIDGIAEGAPGSGPVNAAQIHLTDRAEAESKVNAWLDRRRQQPPRPEKGDDHTSTVPPTDEQADRPNTPGAATPTEPPEASGTPIAQLQKRLGLLMPTGR